MIASDLGRLMRPWQSGIADSKDSGRQASDLTSKSKETQANTLHYSMRKEADDILYSFGLSHDNRKSTTQYQTSPRLTLLSEEILSANEEV